MCWLVVVEKVASPPQHLTKISPPFISAQSTFPRELSKALNFIAFICCSRVRVKGLGRKSL